MPPQTQRSATFHYWIYQSKMSLAAALSKRTLTDIYHQSQRNNRHSGITGFICFQDGYFFQYIEGEEIILKQLRAVIMQDARHKNIHTLAEGTHDKRLFGAWSMHCFDLDNSQTDQQISPYLQNFTPQYWQASEAHALVKDIQRHYDENDMLAYIDQYTMQVASYLTTRLKRILTNKNLKPMLASKR